MAKFMESIRYLWDMFTLFSGISTASGLKRTQGRPVRVRGIFMFRTGRSKPGGGF
jgi:hypothetical protein